MMQISSSSSSSSIRNLVLGLGIVVFAVVCVFIPSFPLISAQGNEVPSASPASSPFPTSSQPDCFNSILNMSDCLTYVESGSNLTKPEKGCCPALAGLVESSPICLCQLLGNGGSTFGITLDVNKAIKLPKVCKVDTPPISLCSAVGVPVSVPPTSSEGPAAASSMSPLGGGGGGGGAATPGSQPLSSSPDTMKTPSSLPKGGGSSSSLIRDYYSSSSSISLIFFSCTLAWIYCQP